LFGGMPSALSHDPIDDELLRPYDFERARLDLA
jgi:hypothetical protein